MFRSLNISVASTTAYSNTYSITLDIPPHWIDKNVSDGVVLEAGTLSGLVYRLRGFQPRQETVALVDAVPYLQALEKGCVVLTGNLRDFDFMQQILPAGWVLFYR